MTRPQLTARRRERPGSGCRYAGWSPGPVTRLGAVDCRSRGLIEKPDALSAAGPNPANRLNGHARPAIWWRRHGPILAVLAAFVATAFVVPTLTPVATTDD